MGAGELAFWSTLVLKAIRNRLLDVNFSERLSSLSEADFPVIIQMAWEDRTAFETI